MSVGQWLLGIDGRNDWTLQYQYFSNLLRILTSSTSSDGKYEREKEQCLRLPALPSANPPAGILAAAGMDLVGGGC